LGNKLNKTKYKAILTGRTEGQLSQKIKKLSVFQTKSSNKYGLTSVVYGIPQNTYTIHRIMKARK